MKFRSAVRPALILATLFLVISRICDAADAAPRIAPYHAEVFFSRTASNSASRKPVWTDQIRDSSGKPLYDISLEPDYRIGDYLIILNLVLRDVNRPDEYNLLCPDDICIGFQAFEFVGRDLTQGPEKSIYGPRHSMRVPGRNMVVTATVIDAQVSPISDTDDFQVDTLHLNISAENVPNPRASITSRNESDAPPGAAADPR